MSNPIETICLLALAIEAFQAHLKNTQTWVPEVALLTRERGFGCNNTKIAAKIFNVESQEIIKQKIDELHKFTSEMKKICDNLPPERWWEEGN